ncbi:type 1 fimbrial protein [uncultured Pantoea sp.]|uniref:type 1 fimbrial protein n=1 Tax=uncultured Pantoea sp. TaxID=218084 RepID=UPI0025DED177|nr:type 1 fimbrial protein [uncultured Pantoea sp.]
MKSRFSLCLSALLVTLVGPVSAGSQTGTLIFSGAITNGSCDMNLTQNPVELNCYDPASGKAIVKTADLMKPETVTGLPIEIKMRWINPEKNKGIIEVTYL